MGVSGGGRRLGGVGIGSKEHHKRTEVWCIFLWKIAVRVCVCVCVTVDEGPWNSPPPPLRNLEIE